jgi:GTP cyclohydrolase II
MVGGQAARLAGRAVERAIDELRRGLPVVVDHADGLLLVAAAETVGPAGLQELLDAALGHPVLVLTGARAAALNPDRVLPEAAPVALKLPPLVLPPLLRGLADPTAVAAPTLTPEPAPAPAGAEAALALARLARLLPAMLAAPAAADADLSGLLRADAVAIDAHAGRQALLERTAEAMVPLADAADTRVVSFRGADGGIEHLAIIVGQPELAALPLVRIHSECFTGDLLGSLRCDCGPQLHRALRRMHVEGAGVLLYLAQEGRGIGLANKLRAYALQDRGLDTLDANHALGWEADARDFSVAGAMLRQLGLTQVRLLTNNPRKLAALEAAGIAVRREAHVVPANGVNDAYLATKAARFGHLP